MTEVCPCCGGTGIADDTGEIIELRRECADVGIEIIDGDRVSLGTRPLCSASDTAHCVIGRSQRDILLGEEMNGRVTYALSEIAMLRNDNR